MRTYLFTSESVSEGHPDKICDQLSDAVLDSILEQDPDGRVACECFVTTGLVVVGGEIRANALLDLQSLVRNVIRDIGYTQAEYRFDSESCCIVNVLHRQSPDIAMGVDRGGAGDQGLMFGYACTETPELMPLPIMLAHALVRRLAHIRKNESHVMPYLRPDAKSQVTVEYTDSGEVLRVDAVVVSTQHDPDVSQEQLQHDVISRVIYEVIPEHLLDRRTRFYINPTGRFEIGGPHGDTGLTGRKIIVDTYGGRAPHGGGAFSGKDPTKVDRSGAYMARYLAKNIVAAGLARECSIQLAYVIGIPEPISLHVNTHCTGSIPAEALERFIRENIDLTPRGIIERFQLQRPLYRQTAVYGHFGRPEFPWEQLDLVPKLQRLA
ncbi:MAG: methionine adenosyltransferase [Candidatus Kapabacteria bacterium]|nr:methionine adenosyltransferase [Candidatus Kapabacteria bacterium]MCS7169889.1 methionine adenosyltransferase [Candidatus Kapabacteria bacterium]MDW7997669.1 methionine adenosyltransferase [Bacteroidota bacterium]MDW8225004.1 methionine adenosyltransferase [Bacteroidota bacterium]